MLGFSATAVAQTGAASEGETRLVFGASHKGGVAAFEELFEPASPWAWVKHRIGTYSFHIEHWKWNAADFISQDALQNAVDMIRHYDLQVQVETGGLRPYPGSKDPANWSIAGELQAMRDFQGLDRWEALGGRVDVIIMDAPFSKMETQSGMPWTVAAMELIDYMRLVRTRFPNVVFGLIEPVPRYHVQSWPPSHPIDYGNLLSLLDLMLFASEIGGEKLDFFLADSPADFNDVTPGDGWAKLVALEHEVVARGLEFGWFCNDSTGGATSNQLFYERSLAGYDKLRAAGGNPTWLNVRSWYPFPTATVPETEPYTMTNLARVLLHRFDHDQGSQHRWPGSHPRVSLYFSETLRNRVPTYGNFDQGILAARRAALQWNQQGASELRFVIRGSTQVAEVANDGINAILFSDEACTHGEECLGDLVLHAKDGHRLGFDVLLHTRAAETDRPIEWSIDGSIPGTQSLEGVLLRQLGQAAGLGFTEDPSSPLAAACQGGCQLPLSIGAAEEQELQNLYGPYTNEGFWTQATVVAPGDTIRLNLDYPDAANRTYAVFLSLAGAEGFTLSKIGNGDSRHFAINGPVVATWESPSAFTKFAGVLDANGQATARLRVPANLTPGIDFHFTAVTIDNLHPNSLQNVGVGVSVRIE